MNNFIEVTSSKGDKRLVNVLTISAVYPSSDGCVIITLSTNEQGSSRAFTVTESYEEVKSLIREALS